MPRSHIYNLPNSLSLVRIVCIPLLILLCSWSWRWAGLAAAVVFALAAVTDFLDGYLARKMGRVTVLGRFLDPVADKLIVSAAMIMLVAMDRAPAWVVFVIIGREIAVTGLRAAAAAAAEGLVIDAGWWGKAKTVSQIVAILGLLVHEKIFGLEAELIGTVGLYAALGLTILSGYFYFKDYWAVISRS
ncbi:MAG: CDP-diacylglycerol--glycerol-3-phosphate 3-phosphatidyltransferase [Deltaproteobacteria bacterium]|nr:CDP-diacylglycerol--glycerol-3-phosphate 3-phosphatidyltransferase [Deltaproteobacteria bacterium]